MFLIDLFYIACKIASNLLRTPYYLARNLRLYVHHYLKPVIDRTMNLEMLYSEKIPSIDLCMLQKLLGGPQPDLHLLFENKYGNINFHEAVAIAYIVQAVRPKRLFEIGTFDGFSTYHLAANAPDDARIFTLNLPADTPFREFRRIYSLTEYHGDRTTHEALRSTEIGELYRKHGVSRKVTQLFGDSLRFDFAPYRKTMDVVFIDGGHSYAHVESDSREAMAMAAEKGIILWHDYNVQHRDIRRFLNAFSEERRLYHIRDTRLVVYLGEPSSFGAAPIAPSIT